MIAALILHTLCYVFMVKGVPNWLELVLSIVSAICTVVALILWEETKDRIKVLENKTKKGGE
jgi:hypothetical protein